MKRVFQTMRAGWMGAAFGFAIWSGAWAADDWVPLDLKLPQAVFAGTPPNMVLTEHMEPPPDPKKPRPPFLAPKGTRNVALHQPVTCSDPKPIEGSPALVTDGSKDGGEDGLLVLHRELQWVQVDLGQPCRIHAVVVWHAYDMAQLVRDVVVQVADDPEFTKNVRTLFNNDYDATAGFGVGKDKEYFETYEGRLVPGQGEAARFVRCYSRGGTASALNRYAEVEVYGQPVP
jgi:hypothetical protein